MKCPRCFEDDISGPVCSCGYRPVPASASVAGREDLIRDMQHWRDRATAAERARDLLIDMSISFLPKTYPAEPYLLETAVTGRESFATREEAVARLLEVAGVTNPEESPP